MLQQSATLLQAGQLLGYNFWQKFACAKKWYYLGLIEDFV